jgi:hypothetical protein
MLGEHAGAAPGAAAPVVIEHFTSQGCSSCLPADAFLAELSSRIDVIALSLHVDYWDYLGWRDTLGSPDCAERQRKYASRRGDGRVYTPQMIVNGQAEFLGSDRQGVLHAIARELARHRRGSVPVSIASGDRELVIDIAPAPSGQLRVEATVWVISALPQVVIEIRRGANAGRTVAYANVVRKIVPAGVWHGDEVELSLPKAAILGAGNMCVALLQVDGSGPIIGAGSRLVAGA